MQVIGVRSKAHEAEARGIRCAFLHDFVNSRNQSDLTYSTVRTVWPTRNAFGGCEAGEQTNCFRLNNEYVRKICSNTADSLWSCRIPVSGRSDI